MKAPIWQDRLVSRLILPMHDAYRWLRPSYRPVIATARRSRNFRERARLWPEERKREWVLHRLRSLLRRAAIEAPHYRELFRDAGFDPRADFGFDDFARLPVLSKDQLRDAPERLRSSALPDKLVRPDATGGSTGQPIRVWKGPVDRGWAEGGWSFFLRGTGVPRGARTAFFWGHHLDAHTPRRTGIVFSELVQNAHWFDCFRLDEPTLLEHHARLTALAPDCLIAYASALASLATVLDRYGLRASYPRQALITGAEKVWAHEREVIERVFGQPVHERYGSRDVGLIGFQEAPGQTQAYTIDWANVLVEPEEPASSANILVTKLNADAMFLVRYRIGDVGVFTPGSRPGEPVFSLPEVLGRELEGIVRPDGGWIHGTAFPHMLKDYPIADFQVHQRQDGTVTVRVVPRSDWGPDHEHRLQAGLAALAPGVTMRIATVAAIPRTEANKRRPVISELAQAGRRR